MVIMDSLMSSQQDFLSSFPSAELIPPQIMVCSPVSLNTARRPWTGSSTFAPVIVNVPPPRPSASPPHPVPVVHSPAYLYRLGATELRASEGEDDISSTPSPSRAVATQTTRKQVKHSNPLKRALASADDMLNDLEQNPDPTTQAIWKVTDSAAGRQAAKGVRGAAELTVQAGTEAVRLAVPVGAWAVKQGLRIAMNLVSEAQEERKSSREVPKKSEEESE